MNIYTSLHNKSKKELINVIDSLQKDLQLQDAFIKELQEALALARARHFGTKSEKENDEGDVFDEAISPDNTPEIATADESISIATHSRKKPGRKPLPKELPRVQVIYDLSEEQKICACGCQLSPIGQEVSEQLDIIPAKIQVIEHVKLKYACKACEDTIKTAQAPKQPIPKSIASPGLLAHVAVSKFADHLPLYRQEAIFQRMGVNIARNTLSLWMIKAGQLLLPLYKLLQDTIVGYDIAYADETRVQVLNEPNRPAQSQSYMWCFVGGAPDKRSIIYHYDPGRAHTVIEEVLDDFKGYLHCDGFSGYDTYSSDRQVEQVGCWMHARRRFIEVTKVAKKEGLAHKSVAVIAKLYQIERKIKELELAPDKTYSYRQQHAKPLLTTFKKWLDDNVSKVLPKSAIGEAIRYSLNQWPKLIRYLYDGRLEIDNGLSERTIKPFVIGRKNWLFSQSVAGVQSAEIIYSLIETCKAHKIEPYAYLRHVFTQLPLANTEEELQVLLPFNVTLNSF